MFVYEHEFFVSKHSKNDIAIGIVAPSMVCGRFENICLEHEDDLTWLKWLVHIDTEDD